jgi:hypothetical protein
MSKDLYNVRRFRHQHGEIPWSGFIVRSRVGSKRGERVLGVHADDPTVQVEHDLVKGGEREIGRNAVCSREKSGRDGRLRLKNGFLAPHCCQNLRALTSCMEDACSTIHSSTSSISISLRFGCFVSLSIVMEVVVVVVEQSSLKRGCCARLYKSLFRLRKVPVGHIDE